MSNKTMINKTMILWEKPNGSQIETNDNPANIAQAEKLGWKQPKDAPKSLDVQVHEATNKKTVAKIIKDNFDVVLDTSSNLDVLKNEAMDIIDGNSK